MRNVWAWLAVLALALAATGCSNATGKGARPLFNGKNLDGWTVFAPEAGPDQSPFSVADGVIHCTGTPVGYVRTVEQYDNYVLNVEWRWLGEPGNSGILLHAVEPDQVWPACIEVQLRAGNAGDVIAIGDARVAEKQPAPGAPHAVVPKQQPSNERDPGDWNQAQVYCVGRTVRVYINGELQNYVTGASPASGWIALQSEGAPIEFRSITLDPLDQAQPQG